MNSKISILLLAASCLVQQLSSQTTNVVGTLPGDLVVDNTGAATYTIPLEIPPGTAGMQPDLSLEYNSHSGNGIMGVGWSIGGLSTITRSPATVVHDGFVDGVDFDASDRFSIDGQRLIDVVGIYGAADSEYRTEVESFSKIVAYGQVGSGPQYFKVWTKAGLIMTYGDTGSINHNASFVPVNSPNGAVLNWSLSRVEDTLGNYMEFEYELDTLIGEQILRFIRYTGNSDDSGINLYPYNQVEFSYIPRSNKSDFDGSYPNYGNTGIKTQLKQLLDKIKVKQAGNVKWEYQLDYQHSELSSEKIQLNSIMRVSGDEYLELVPILADFHG